MPKNIYNNIDRVKRATPLITGLLLVLTNLFPGPVNSLLILFSAPVATPPPVDLELGDTGATSWNFTNIKPGDSGTSTVTLHNAGTADGFVTIWISDIVDIRRPAVDTKLAGSTGELFDYMLLDLSSRGLESNVSLPAVSKSFPRTPFDSHFVKINPLLAGETLSLTWKWELPYQTGNNIQGKGTSFSLNYMLEELSSALPAPPSPAVSASPSAEIILPAPKVNIGISGYRRYTASKSRL